MKQSEAIKHFREEYEVAARVDSDGVVKVQARDLIRLFNATPDSDPSHEPIKPIELSKAQQDALNIGDKKL